MTSHSVILDFGFWILAWERFLQNPKSKIQNESPIVSLDRAWGVVALPLIVEVKLIVSDLFWVHE
jgi:hypothetical protein